MLKDNKECSTNENYFSYFNHKLYENPSDIQEEENYLNKICINSQSSEESSTNTSHESLNPIDNEEELIPLNLLDLSPIKTDFGKEEKDDSQFPMPRKLFNTIEENDKFEDDSKAKQLHPYLQKYKLPKSLFSNTKTKNCENIDKSISQNSPLASLVDRKLNINSQSFKPKYDLYPVIIYKNTYFFNNLGNKFGQFPINYCKKINVEKKKNKKKQEFVEREGDWSCYRCKNINFSFRDKCNKCQLSKEESEKKFIEVGEAMLKLVDKSIYDSNKSDKSK